MERPGFLELAVYALVLAVAGGWVYAVPPFDYEPVNWVRSAPLQPASGEAQAEEAGAETDSISLAIGEPPVAQTQTAGSAAADPEAEVGPDPRPNLLVVTARSLNMRSEPDAGSALVGNYPRGALVEQVDKSGNWMLVRAEDDVTGWMYGGYLGNADSR